MYLNLVVVSNQNNIYTICTGNTIISRLDTVNGGYSHNLYTEGVFLYVDVKMDSVTFMFDLRKNLRVRNKQANDYQDAVWFSEESKLFNSIQIALGKIPKLQIYSKYLKASQTFVQIIHSLAGDKIVIPVSIGVERGILHLSIITNR